MHGLNYKTALNSPAYIPSKLIQFGYTGLKTRFQTCVNWSARSEPALKKAGDLRARLNCSQSYDVIGNLRSRIALNENPFNLAVNEKPVRTNVLEICPTKSIRKVSKSSAARVCLARPGVRNGRSCARSRATILFHELPAREKLSLEVDDSRTLRPDFLFFREDHYLLISERVRSKACMRLQPRNERCFLAYRSL